MIRRLLILLLIVGCAHKPPSAQFYLGMTEEEFDAIADTFRNQRVWRIEQGQCVKDITSGEIVLFMEKLKDYLIG